MAREGGAIQYAQSMPLMSAITGSSAFADDDNEYYGSFG